MGNKLSAKESKEWDDHIRKSFTPHKHKKGLGPGLSHMFLGTGKVKRKIKRHWVKRSKVKRHKRHRR